MYMTYRGKEAGPGSPSPALLQRHNHHIPNNRPCHVLQRVVLIITLHSPTTPAQMVTQCLLKILPTKGAFRQETQNHQQNAGILRKKETFATSNTVLSIGNADETCGVLLC
ncbi:hypothetical protein POM88_011507 [Heracleum sosnowskyi]|uniref:Uncharacterized protein n=1 Tax=Heracleum sosnowskyi TaxID=360622 RepID=A0AAD8IVL4_9APIA|nr:hypothetical protein POM88_011507 [Heracleum sosnowskyi]